MLFFASDYMEGAHPAILQRLQEINLQPHKGYGMDEICDSAKQRIRKAIEMPEAEIHFLVGGTQTNATVIGSVLRQNEGVLCAASGHINVHESGAIEATGHKVMALPHENGLLSADVVEQALRDYFADENYEHMVYPGMVYISHPSEYGTIYSADQLSKLHQVCQKYNIPLFLDGARLGYGLAAETDVDLKFIAENTDVFYIGGTKVGALFGEAVVFPKPGVVPHFYSMIKQHGALLSKGWLLGVQFDELFKDERYIKISKNAIAAAMRIKKALINKGYRLFIDSETNQQFVIVKNEKLEQLRSKVQFGFIEKYDDTHTVIRFATSWATTDSDVDRLIEVL